jgi:hypothetical protein
MINGHWPGWERRVGGEEDAEKEAGGMEAAIDNSGAMLGSGRR